MRNVLLLISVCFWAGCLPKNPFYRWHLSSLPYQERFDASKEHPHKILKGAGGNIKPNVFSCIMPDSLGGKSVQGDCVLSITMNKAGNKVKKVEIIGISAFDLGKGLNIYFERYDGGNKYVHQKLPKNVIPYLHYFEDFCKNMELDGLKSKEDSAITVICEIFYPIKLKL